MIARLMAPVVVVADLYCMNWLWVGMIGVWVACMMIVMRAFAK